MQCVMGLWDVFALGFGPSVVLTSVINVNKTYHMALCPSWPSEHPDKCVYNCIASVQAALIIPIIRFCPNLIQMCCLMQCFIS